MNLNAGRTAFLGAVQLQSIGHVASSQWAGVNVGAGVHGGDRVADAPPGPHCPVIEVAREAL
jgi:hypothetical protein